ncbi:hypothetical protein CT150_24715 [Escherichia coli]|nr:hypothetical protein CT150_24715 [Escherichia coli]
MTDFGGKTSIFSHPVYLFLRKFSLQDSRGGSPYHFHVFDKKSSSCMIDFVDRFDRIFSFYPVFCMVLK